MDAFYNTHKHLLEKRPYHIRRSLMDDIDKTARVICIRGARGVGKTSFLLDYASENCPGDQRSCLYVSLNHFYFTVCSLYEFARQFYASGGRLLLLDQIFKYPGWSTDIAKSVQEFADLRIVFTTTCVDQLDTPESLQSVMKVYELRKLSFREFYNFRSHQDIPPIALEDVLTKHNEIASVIVNKVHPGDLFQEYLAMGNQAYNDSDPLQEESRIRQMNMMLEVDVIYIHQIDPGYLHKFRRLLYLLLSQGTSSAPNVTMLSKEIGVSRATVMNYMKYLDDAQLIRMIYKDGEGYPKKPYRIFINNISHVSAIYPYTLSSLELYKVFILNHLTYKYNVSAAIISGADFSVEGQYHFKISEMMRKGGREGLYYAISNLGVGHGAQIPLWLFGFLY